MFCWKVFLQDKRSAQLTLSLTLSLTHLSNGYLGNNSYEFLNWSNLYFVFICDLPDILIEDLVTKK